MKILKCCFISSFNALSSMREWITSLANFDAGMGPPGSSGQKHKLWVLIVSTNTRSEVREHLNLTFTYEVFHLA